MNPGRLVFPAVRWRAETGFAHVDRELDEALDAGVGGFIVFGVPKARQDEVAEVVGRIRQRAGRPLLIGADLERGAGQQARGLTEIPPPAALASLADDEVVAWAGRATAREALGLGINFVFAPVADLDWDPRNPIIQTRSFGRDPAVVSRHVATWIRAAQAEGVLACAKHYPGHGRTWQDSHDLTPAVETSLEELAAFDLRPFAAAVEADVASVMTAHVRFPAWDATGEPATRSAVMLGYLRQRLGHRGLVVTDALVMAGARGGSSPDEAILAPVRAGCDLLLYPPDAAAAAVAVGRAAEADRAVAAAVEAALARYGAALDRASTGSPGQPGPAPDPAAGSVAERLLAGGIVRGGEPDLRGLVELVIVDDDLGGPHPPGPNDLVRRALARARVPEGHGGRRVVLAFAEPRMSKGRSGFGPASREALARSAPGAAVVVLFGHPRLVGEIPGEAPVLVAWHRQPLMQAAVAAWLAARIR